MNKLEEFLFGYVDRRSELGDDEYAGSYLADLERAAYKHKRIAPFASAWNHVMCQNFSKSGAIGFLGRRFPALIQEIANLRPVLLLASGAEDFRFGFAQKLRTFYVGHLKVNLYNAYRQRSSRELSRKVLEAALKELEATLERTKPRILVLSQDSLFLERLVVKAARNVGVPTCAVQDGLYMAANHPDVYHGHTADLIAVWGDHFRDLYQMRGDRRPEDCQVLGYPYSLPLSFDPPTEADSICILGQPWDAYSTEAAAAKIRMVRNVLAAGGSRWRVVYRPHPRESRRQLGESFPHLSLTHPEESLEGAFARYGCFISLTSTALFEAALRQRAAIQILDPAIRSDKFHRYGFAVSVPNQATAIRRYLPKQNDSSRGKAYVPPEFVHVPDHPGERLLELMEAYIESGQESRSQGA